MTHYRIITLFVALLVSVAAAQQLDEHLAQVKVQVTDEAGVPVARARVVVSTYTSWVPGRKGGGRDEYNNAAGLTDANGTTTLELKGSSGRYGCIVLPLPEYHWDRGKEYVFTNTVAGKWDPWGATISIVLKRKAAPDYSSMALEALPKTEAAGKEAGVSKDPLVAAPQNPVGTGAR